MYEAAEIDGAGRVRQFLSITLPQLKYTIITSSTLMVVGSLTFFDLIFVLTAGGPGDATRVLALDMYKTGFPGQPDGPGQRDRGHPRPRRPRAGAAAAPDRRRARTPTASWKEPDVATTVTATADTSDDARPRARRGARAVASARTGWAALSGWLWLVIVIVPIYWIVITSFKTQANYYATNPLVPPALPDARQLPPGHRQSDFVRVLRQQRRSSPSGTIVPAVLVSFMAAFAIVRGRRLVPHGRSTGCS